MYYVHKHELNLRGSRIGTRWIMGGLSWWKSRPPLPGLPAGLKSTWWDQVSSSFFVLRWRARPFNIQQRIINHSTEFEYPFFSCFCYIMIQYGIIEKYPWTSWLVTRILYLPNLDWFPKSYIYLPLYSSSRPGPIIQILGGKTVLNQRLPSHRRHFHTRDLDKSQRYPLVRWSSWTSADNPWYEYSNEFIGSKYQPSLECLYLCGRRFGNAN